LVAREAVHELFGAAFGDRTQVFYGLLCAHADAVVGDRERLGLGVEGHADFEVRGVFVQSRVVQRLEAQLVTGVGGVGDQLAQKNLFV